LVQSFPVEQMRMWPISTRVNKPENNDRAPLDTSYIGRQMRFDPIPLLIAQPKQLPAHDPDPLKESGRYGITIVLPPQQN